LILRRIGVYSSDAPLFFIVDENTVASVGCGDINKRLKNSANAQKRRLKL